MKSGFIGFRTEEDLKAECEKIAALNNMTLSKWIELQMKLGAAKFKKKHKFVGKG